ncbi:hypothetical protein HBI56_172390 [Parastagonospora nodorum]|uniref:Uncharacterized protein n=1 Tax=Phaeosphaeria nodorum (strain SN15 / ATCC MYA-4574 / FGSC 10173) TaxID=321614 RepID=A0A7U2F3V7_PHANO|nr:hypothetical protein HBH56_221120 [Parastagonospora nodorum]QRC97143.1 hypothetical protein JI435_410180 [Parastagonospora nodorum SN15]KAH3924028.1 hypothetical protein HBH54_200620 [Parastagonospora nodorum]KAH3944450.1 hypothetical protein HBH53_156990 [Parastagonospora nodorum]KAH3963474.1 hypothetical protein HBH51_167700 [Parastagonospora nodorum]
MAFIGTFCCWFVGPTYAPCHKMKGQGMAIEDSVEMSKRSLYLLSLIPTISFY